MPGEKKEDVSQAGGLASWQRNLTDRRQGGVGARATRVGTYRHLSMRESIRKKKILSEERLPKMTLLFLPNSLLQARRHKTMVVYNYPDP